MLYAELFDIFITPAEDVVSGIEAAFAAAAVTLRETDYADACPIATIALEVASTSEPLRQATADVFSHTIAKGTETFQRFGLPEDKARSLAVTVITSWRGRSCSAGPCGTPSPSPSPGRPPPRPLVIS